MNYDSRYGEFYYSEHEMIEWLKENFDCTDEDLDGSYEVLDIEETDDGLYIVEGTEEELDWEDIKDRYDNPAVICDGTDDRPVISKIVVSKW